MQKATNNNTLISLLKGLIFLFIIFQAVVTIIREFRPFVSQPFQITLNENTKLVLTSFMLGNATAFLNKLADVKYILVLRDKRMSRVASSTSLLETIKILNELGIK